MTRTEYDNLAHDLLKDYKRTLNERIAGRIIATPEVPGDYQWVTFQTLENQTVAAKITNLATQLPFLV